MSGARVISVVNVLTAVVLFTLAGVLFLRTSDPTAVTVLGRYSLVSVMAGFAGALVAVAYGLIGVGRGSARVQERMALIGGSTAAVLIGCEVVLRSAPVLVPAQMVDRLPSELRLRVAQAKNLPTFGNFAYSSAVVRHWRPGAMVGGLTGSGQEPVWRADEIGYKNPHGWYSSHREFAVVAVGDSMTEGLGVGPSETYVSLLTARYGYPSLNLGHVGNTFQQELESLRLLGLPKRPKIVLWGVYSGNDFGEAEGFELALRQFGSAERWDLSKRGFGNAENVVLRSSYALSFFKAGFNLVRLEAARRWGAPDVAPWMLPAPSPVAEIRASRGWTIFRATLKEAEREAAAVRGALVVVYLPTPAEVERPERYRLAQAVETLAAELGIGFVDPSPALHRMVREHGSPAFLPRDVHLSRFGHEVVAAEVARHLAARGVPGG